MTKKERPKDFQQVVHFAKKKMNHFLRKHGVIRKIGVKEWNYIYEFSILIGNEIENPTKTVCYNWLYFAYKEQKMEPLKKTDRYFYMSVEWKRLRIKVFNKYGYKCMRCGSTDFLCIDHIKPRSIYKELELDINNMQVLCRKCNSIKSNRRMIDYRAGNQQIVFL